MTVQDLIDGANILISQQAYPANATRDMRLLNDMLDSWWVAQLSVAPPMSENFPLIVNQSTYNIGAGGDFDTVRPEDIIDAFIRDSSDIDYPVNLITQSEWNAKPDKAFSIGVPTDLFYDPQNPMGSINLYPIPDDTVYTLYLTETKPFTEFVNLTDVINFPPGWARAIKYNGAIEIAPANGTTVSTDVKDIAKLSLRALKNMNSRPQAAKFDFVSRPFIRWRQY